MVQGQVFLKGGLAHSKIPTFSKIYHFDIQKLLYPLQNSIMHLKKNNFFCHNNFMKKGHSKMSKNEPENIP